MNQLHSESRSYKFHFILWGTLVFIACIITWAYFATLDEVTIAMGTVIPSKKVQVIQNLEGGIIKEIFVREGQDVKKGQLLITLDDTRFASAFNEIETQIDALRIKQLRLNAEIHNRTFNVPKNLAQKYPDLVDTETALLNSRKSELGLMKENHRLIDKELNLTRPLLQRGAVSEVEILRLEQQLSEIKRQISSFNSQALDEINTVSANIKNLQEKIQASKDRVKRTLVRSPVDGIVKQIYVNTVGGVVKPGMSLVEVVPADEKLLVEARVRPNNIGFISIGQQAYVKISAFDFSIYGSLKAKVVHISADTSVDEDNNPYYEVWVKTDRNYLGTEASSHRIKVGMQASVDIVTGRKSVLNYLLKPLLKAKQTALRER